MSMASNNQQQQQSVTADLTGQQQHQQQQGRDPSIQSTTTTTTSGGAAATTSCEDDDLNKQRQIELEEERKLRAKHPSIQRPGSEFLQKRLQRGQKYFDSGDYNMAKASTNSTIKLPDNATPVTAIDSKVLNKRH